MVIHGTYLEEYGAGTDKKHGAGVTLAAVLKATNGAWVYNVVVADEERETLVSLGEKIDTQIDLSPFKGRDPETTRLVFGYKITYEPKDGLPVSPEAKKWVDEQKVKGVKAQRKSNFDLI
jgi:hypothetical protein